MDASDKAGRIVRKRWILFVFAKATGGSDAHKSHVQSEAACTLGIVVVADESNCVPKGFCKGEDFQFDYRVEFRFRDEQPPVASNSVQEIFP